MIKVTLDRAQVSTAINIGIERATKYLPQFEGITVKKNYDLERNGGNWQEFASKQVDAVGAESAIAEYVGLMDFIPLNGTFKDIADVGDNLEVKHTRRPDGNLIITSIDRDDDIAVLVIGCMPTFSLIGWRPVNECKQDKYRSERLIGDSYLVPSSELYPMQRLRMIGERACGFAQI